MIRSMYSAVSGLRSHQLMMDMVGNNISNVNTHGFKRTYVLFQEVLNQSLSGATAPTDVVGGTNPAQVGLGSTVSATPQNFSQGFLQITNRELDVALQGDGFFVVNNGAEPLYSRSGSFFLDAESRLVTSDGSLVQGWSALPDGTFDPALDADFIRVPLGDLQAPIVTSEVTLAGNLPSNSLVGDVVSSGVELYDTQGNTVPLTVLFTKTAADQWTATASYGDPPTNVPLTDNVVTFVNGEVTVPADFNINIAAGAVPDVGAVSLVIGGNSERKVTQFGDVSTLAVATQNGFPAGSLQTISISPTGDIMGAFSNGQTQPIARLSLATFANPGGLERVTGSTWRPTVNSGLAQVGQANTGNRGLVAPGSLEMSNVDLAQEFTTLIQAQRGFQANSRVVTSADELLQEIVNLKR
ncbi:MAG: flagellar hook protein FlgE [Actinomycetota bacterium]